MGDEFGARAADEVVGAARVEWVVEKSNMTHSFYIEVSILRWVCGGVGRRRRRWREQVGKVVQLMRMPLLLVHNFTFVLVRKREESRFARALYV